MDINKLTMNDVSSFDYKQSREVEEDIRRQLSAIRVDMYVNHSSTSCKVRGLKKGLARIMTLRTKMLNEKSKG